MATMLSNRRSTFGINCVQCHEELIAPEKSEYRDGTHIRHLWLCPKCATHFEIDRADSRRGHDDGRHFSIAVRRIGSRSDSPTRSVSCPPDYRTITPKLQRQGCRSSYHGWHLPLRVHAADFACGSAERIAGNWSAVTVS